MCYQIHKCNLGQYLNVKSSTGTHLNISMCISLFMRRSPNKHERKTPLGVCVSVEASQCGNKSLGKEKQTNKTELLHKEAGSASALSAGKHFSTSMHPFSDLSFLSLSITFSMFSLQCLRHPNKYNHVNLCTCLLLCATISACVYVCVTISACVFVPLFQLVCMFVPLFQPVKHAAIQA